MKALCNAFGETVYETEKARSVYNSGARLVFVSGYYGYGKTVGIGGYIICKARENNDKYLYINLRNLKQYIQNKQLPISSINISGILEIFKTLYQLIENKVDLLQIGDNIIASNIEDLNTRIARIKDNIDNIDVVGMYKSIFSDIPRRVYIILDELEGAASNLEDAIRDLCDQSRSLYDALDSSSRKQGNILARLNDARLNFAIIVLIQEVELRKRKIEARCDTGGSPGISRTIRLNGYGYNDYLRIFQQLGLKGLESRQAKKLLKTLEELPPRLVFELLKQGQVESIEDFEDKLKSSVLGSKEEFLLLGGVPPENEDEIEIIASEFFETLRKAGVNIEFAKNNTYKIYLSDIKCNGNVKLSFCLDLRKVHRKEIKCDIMLRQSRSKNVELIANGHHKIIDVPFVHFLAAFSSRDSVFTGLNKYYEDVKEVIINNILSIIENDLCTKSKSIR